MVWTLRKKILSGYGLSLVLTCLVLFWAVYVLRTLGSASAAILRENYKSILAAGNMLEALERQNSALLLHLMRHDPESESQFTEYGSQFLQWLSRAKDNITVPGEKEILDALEAEYMVFARSHYELERVQEQGDAPAERFYREAVLLHLEATRAKTKELRELNQDTMYRASKRAGVISHGAIISTLAIGVSSIAIGLAFSIFLTRLLVRPLLQMLEATRRLSEGDYDVRVEAGSSDELGTLAQGFTAMAGKLKNYHELNIDRIVAEKSKSEAIIRSIEDGIILIDKNLQIADVNPAGLEALGLRGELRYPKHFLELLNNAELFAYIKETAETGRTPKIEETKNILSLAYGSGTRYLQFSITPVISSKQKILGVVMLLRDVTKLKELDRLKSEFVMTASHELKTPLTSISMSIKLLKENLKDGMDKKNRELLNAADEEVQRLQSLVRDLLELSRIEAGKIELSFKRVRAIDIVTKAVQIMQKQADEKSVAIVWKPDKRKGDFDVRVDADKVAWVITNLIANALRYTDSEGKISLAAQKRGEFMHISVTDTGTGIPYDYQSKIFDKFVQVKETSGKGGSGLGLAICKEIVRAHRGTIWVESSPGKGSTFTFTLPLSKTAPQEA